MLKSKRGLLYLLIVILALSLMLTACAQKEDDGQALNEKKINIGLNNWSENIAVSNMWKILLDEKGYEVELTEGDKAIIYTGVANENLDLGLEAWLPNTDEPYWNRYKEDLEQLGPWYEGTGLGLVVPSYVDINSIEELNDNKDKFIINGNPAIVGIDVGASLMRMTEEAIEAYKLDYELLGGSGPAMMASLKRAYNNNNPIIVTLWNPHWAFAEYDLKYLEDPQNIYGDAENIYIMAKKVLAMKIPR